MKNRTLLTTCLAALAVLGARTASAQSQGFAMDRFNASERGSDWFALDSLDLRGELRPALGVVGEYAFKPIAVPTGPGTHTTVVSDQFFLHPGGSLVLADRVRIAVDVPVALYQHGQSVLAFGQQYSAPNKAALGDVRFGGDVRIVGQYGDPVTVGVGGQVFVPSGQADLYTSDNQGHGIVHATIAGEKGLLEYSAQVGVHLRGLHSTYANAPIGDELMFAAAVGVSLANHKLLIGPEFYGSTVISGGSAAFFDGYSTPLEAILGAHFTFLDDFRFGAAAGPGFSKAYGSPDLRVIASLEWAPAYHAPPPADTDGDGIPDTVDACPTVAGVASPDPRKNGCPVTDRDGDGIPDAEDACPDVAGVRTTDPKTNGCPPDQDGDGIPDAQDACPTVPGIKTDDPKTNGCPSDRDHDGIIDSQDACPDKPGVKTDDPKTNGCPPNPDRDNDGIPNEVDACPDQAGPADPDPKKNGCPKAVVENGQIRILEQVKFAFNSAVILPESDGIMQAVLKVLEEHPEIKHVRVEGHTDNKGSAKYNKDLSGKRAASVMTWLVLHKIDKDRLSAQGFGAERPIESNGTDEGRTANRRVEFHIE
jgi:OOP family OmpA-OmpF porin